MRRSFLLVLSALLSPLAAVGAVASCSNSETTTASTTAGGGSTAESSGHGGGTGAGPHDGGPDAPKDAPSDVVLDAPVVDAGTACSLPGSVQFTQNGIAVVPGAPAGTPDLTFLRLPVGFCAHHYGQVGNARQIRFAPGGELFVASPTKVTTGGGSGGLSSIVVLADDDHDGFADAPITFLDQLPATQGLLFTSDTFYYQDSTRIMKVPYAAGDRQPSGASTLATKISYYTSDLHWPKVLDQAADGTIYVGNGGDQGESCDPAHPAHGAVLKILPGGQAKVVAKGLRNPISIRCTHGAHPQCFGIELAKDYSNMNGGPGREKMFPIRDGDDWGFPCCATKDKPYDDVPPSSDCSTVAPESEGFFIGFTPFGLAFEEQGAWPAPWGNHGFVVLHGIVGSWIGARIVAIELDPNTGLAVPGDDIADGGSTGGMTDFALGWDDNTHAHGRPESLEFSADGRLFVANDANGEIFWISPL